MRQGQYRRSPEAVHLNIGKGLPCSVGIKDNNIVLLLNIGPHQVEEAHAAKTFIELLQSRGGAWMWNNVRNSGEDFGWVLAALEQGTCIWVVDGSFMEELRTDVSGEEWVLYCTRTGHKLSGSFYKESAQAGSYRAERLGPLVIHLLLAAITQHFGTSTKTT